METNWLHCTLWMNLVSVIDTNKLGAFYVSDGTLICNGWIQIDYILHHGWKIHCVNDASKLTAFHVQYGTNLQRTQTNLLYSTSHRSWILQQAGKKTHSTLQSEGKKTTSSNLVCVWPCINGINNVEDQLDATITIYWSSNQLNMFRAILCPSSGAQDCDL